jgi:hypothetical protein
MDIYPSFLGIMAILFAVAAVVLLVMSIFQATSRNWRKSLIYFGLMVLSCVVAAGFHFSRRLF